MPVIRTAINYRQYLVGPAPGETIAVFTKDGHYRHVWFSGFIDREKALQLAGAIPVKLYAKAFTLDESGLAGWVDLDKNQALQGCWYSSTVAAVTLNGIPRIVCRKLSSEA